jgi:dihydrofolate reductase
MGSGSALLLGRRTFEMFAQSWPNRTAEDDPGAPFFNESPKFVFPLTLGSGDRLFDEDSEVKLSLAETEAYDSGVVHLAYRPAQ